MFNCEQIYHLFLIFCGSILIGSILQLLMMALPRKISRRERNYEKAIRYLEALEKSQKATEHDNN